MTVYVDDMKAKFGRMIMCHMIADSTVELEAMARQIGIGLQWIQHKGTYREHFDVCMSKREIAVVHGATPITQRELGRMIEARRKPKTGTTSMKNSIYKLIPFALMIMAVAWLTGPMGKTTATPTAAHSTTQTTGAGADDGIRLWQAIAQAPPEVEAIAEVLGFERFAYVPPRLYTRWNPKRFDRARFDANLAEIKAICHGADWIGTDLEKEPREIIRHPDEYEDHEVESAKAQYRTMWAAFREVFPDAKLLEYNWPSGRRAGHFPLMDQMAVRHLDGLSPSVFWTDHPNWQVSRSERLAHALALGRKHDMPVVPWVFDRYKVTEGQTVTYEPVPSMGLDAMLDLAMSDGIAGLIVWSNVYSVLESADPHRIIAETTWPNYERARVDAWTGFVLGQARLRQ